MDVEVEDVDLINNKIAIQGDKILYSKREYKSVDDKVVTPEKGDLIVYKTHHNIKEKRVKKVYPRPHHCIKLLLRKKLEVVVL